MISFLALFVAVVVIARSFRAAPTAHGDDAHDDAAIAARRRVVVHRAGGAALVVVGVAFLPGALILSKTVARAILPVGLLWLALLLLTVIRLVVDDKRGALKRGALAVVVAVLGNEPLGQWLMQQLEAPFQADPFAAGSFDAVVVLGGGAQEAPHAHFELGPSGDRVFLGARLWKAQKTPLLVTTGTPIEGFQRPFDSLQATTTMWTEVGVDPAAIVTVTSTRTTSEEAAQVATLAKERGWRRIGLVTSAWHLRRATRLFARHLSGSGVDVVPLAADHRGTPSWEGLYSVVPVGNGAYLQQKALWEWIGAAVGR